jgi:glycosyltransferase involved in cell wall biosynthesis
MISVTILTKNSEQYLEKVLLSLSSFDEVVVLDTGSTDTTLEIAKKFSFVSVHEHPFIGFGPTHNVASRLAKHQWILSLDSDEIMTPELADHIHKLQLDDHSVYSFGRTNFYRNKHIRGCGWYPDRVIRLYNKTITCFSDALVHESLVTDNVSVVCLPYSVLHFPYNSVSSFLQKMNMYTDLFAKQHPKKTASLWTAVFHGLFAFFRSYILQRGFLLGSEGFEISWFNMNCAFYKYAKVAERLRNERAETNTLLWPEEKGRSETS